MSEQAIDPRIYERELREGETTLPVPVEVLETDIDLYWHIVRTMLHTIRANNEAGQDTVMIVPVGPVFQYRRFARACAEDPPDLSRLWLFFMDEYVGEDGRLIPEESPLSFRGFVRRELFDLVPPETGFNPEQTFFPDPADPAAYDERLAELGGADLCIAGVGINGHLAFNEPPEPGEETTDEEFLELPSRVLELSRETRTINSNTALRGAFDQVPRRAVTVGFEQIMAARSLRIYLNRPWQSAVVRKLLFAPQGAYFPASLARTHPDVRLTLTRLVAERPQFALK